MCVVSCIPVALLGAHLARLHSALLAGCVTEHHYCITDGQPRPDLPRAHSAGLETRGAGARRGVAARVELGADVCVAHDARRVRLLLRGGLNGVVAGLDDLVRRDGVRVLGRGVVVALGGAVDGLTRRAARRSAASCHCLRYARAQSPTHVPRGLTGARSYHD
jgi:hypothetical protein